MVKPLICAHLFPGIKWERKQIFIVDDDDTTGEYLLMNYENTKRWKKSKYRIPSITVLTKREDVSSMIERDHQAEVAIYKTGETLK